MRNDVHLIGQPTNMPNASPELFTIGHSNRTIDEFTDLLSAHSIELLVDVRAFPGSRRQPHFGQEAIADHLGCHGVHYRHVRALGGRRKLEFTTEVDSCCAGWRNESFRAYAQHTRSSEYASAMEELAVNAHELRTAMMCSEAVPWRCHRWLIADTLVARGSRVLHIIDAGSVRQHLISPFAEVDGAQLSWPGPPSSRSLRLGPALTR